MKTFEKRQDTDLIYWVIDTETIGTMEFSFDKQRVFNFYKDYPQKLTEEELKLFNKENPLLAELAAVKNEYHSITTGNFERSKNKAGSL